jgi:hypothetical protein
MNTGCPIGSSAAWQIGLLRCAEEAATATGSPIAVEESAQVEALPQRGADQGKEPGVRGPVVAPDDLESDCKVAAEARTLPPLACVVFGFSCPALWQGSNP